MGQQGNTTNEKGRVSIWTISAIIFFVLLVGGLIYWGSVTRKSLAPAFTEGGVVFQEQDPLPATLVDDLSLLGDEPRVVFAERTVTSVDEQGGSTYHTRLIQSDRRGERRFPFYETDDLSFEQVSPFGSQDFAVFSALLGTTPYLVTAEGQRVDDRFVPPSMGNVFSEVLSADETYLAYLDLGDANAAPDDFVADATIVVRNLATGDEVRVPSDRFTHGDIKYSRFSLRAFSQDNATLYLTAVWPGQDFGDSESFFALDWRGGTARELTYSSLEEKGAEDVLEFIGVYPTQGFALFNHGPLIPDKSGGLTDRIRLERFDLATGTMTTVYEASNGSISGLLADPVSPDGTRVVVENDLTEGGFRVVDLQTNETLPTIASGIFLSWAGDRDHLAYELQQDSQDAFLALKVADLTTGKVSEIYRQTVLQEGTGLNVVGDVLYSYIGTIR